MSRGPGRIERALRALFDASPDRAFCTFDLVSECFPDVGLIERKHEGSTLRAARKIVATDPDWRIARTYWHRWGGYDGAILFNHGNLQSYALMRMIERASYNYGLAQTLYGHTEGSNETWARAAKALATPEYQKEVTPPDGLWWRWWRQHCAERDGDIARLGDVVGLPPTE
jgi:hypothetical protein